jgi:hypothetical protein
MRNASLELDTALVMVCAMGIGGCQGAVWGNLAVLVASVGIFLGTLSLGRHR